MTLPASAPRRKESGALAAAVRREASTLSRAMDTKTHIYEGTTADGAPVTVTWSQTRCIHAEVCVHGLPDVFRPKRKPWVEPKEAESTADLAAVVFNCPTGALHITEGPEEPTPETNLVTVAPDGPLYVRGDVTIVTDSGEEVLRDTRVALCRCGLSQHKPFCDNSHLGHFEDEGTLGDTAALKADDDATGGLRITLATDGPLLLHGPVTCDGADGQSASGSKTALCRCGGSSNKPFCDGTHRRNGFEAPPPV